MKTKNIIQLSALIGVASSTLFAADCISDTVNQGAAAVKEQASQTAFDVKKFFADLKQKWDRDGEAQDPLKADKSVDHRFNITYAAYSVLPESAQKQVIQYLAKSDSSDFKDLNIHTVAKDGRAQIIDCYLECGGSIEATDKNGNTMLHIATLNADAAGVEVLIQKGINVNAANKRGDTALFIAARSDCNKGCTKVAKLLIDSRANVSARDGKGQTPLFAAALVGNVEAAKLLVGAGARVNVIDNNRDTPLHVACANNQLKMVQYLVEQGALKDAKDNDQLTPLAIAQKNNYTDICKALGS